MSGATGGRAAVWLVARREITERIREKSFLASTGITVLIVVLVAVVPSLLGLGGTTTFTVAVADPAAAPVARAAVRAAPTFDAKVKVERVAPARTDAALRNGDIDAVLTRRGIRAEDDPDDKLVDALQAANRQVQTAAALQRAGLSPAQQRAALSPPPLRVSTLEATDPDRDAKSGFAFVAVLVLFGQILTYGIWVATGVVEEKSSRVVEVLLATVKPGRLLAGKVLGLGVLGFCQILLVAGIGILAASAAGALEVDGDVIAAAALALAWFVLGYAFYAAAYACAGACVPRQEELQSATTPLNTLILISYFVAFAVLQNPDGTLAKVTSFIPITAPVTMPPRIALGAASPLEIVAALVVTTAGAALLVPLAARIYRGAILRTGSAVKLRDAWRAAGA
jgi:ABC-2 type transport system permease protein